MGTITHLCFCGNRKIVSVMEECLPLSIVTSCTPWLSKNTEAQSIVQTEKEVSFHYRHLRNIIVKRLQQAKIKALFFFHKSYKKFGNCTGQWPKITVLYHRSRLVLLWNKLYHDNAWIASVLWTSEAISEPCRKEVVKELITKTSTSAQWTVWTLMVVHPFSGLPRRVMQV